MPDIALNRPDGSDVLILSPQMLHILDKCFWLLPFAIRSDATTAITNAGASLAVLAPRLGFLNGLLAELELPAAREELKRLWTKWIEKTYYDRDGLVAAPVQTGAVAAPAAGPVRASGYELILQGFFSPKSTFSRQLIFYPLFFYEDDEFCRLH